MNPIVVQIANGNAFFIGIGITVIAFALRIFFEKRFQVILLTALWLIGISLVVLSATPIPSWLYVFFCPLYREPCCHPKAVTFETEDINYDILRDIFANRLLC